MRPGSGAAGRQESPQRRIFVVDETRYLKDGSICPTSPRMPWAIYEDGVPLVFLGRFSHREAALIEAARLSDEPSPR